MHLDSEQTGDTDMESPFEFGTDWGYGYGTSLLNSEQTADTDMEPPF